MIARRRHVRAGRDFAGTLVPSLPAAAQLWRRVVHAVGDDHRVATVASRSAGAPDDCPSETTTSTAAQKLGRAEDVAIVGGHLQWHGIVDNRDCDLPWGRAEVVVYQFGVGAR